MKKKIGKLFFAVILCFLAVTGCGPAGTEEAAGTAAGTTADAAATTAAGADAAAAAAITTIAAAELHTPA